MVLVFRVRNGPAMAQDERSVGGPWSRVSVIVE